jgi:hypothetical protein
VTESQSAGAPHAHELQRQHDRAQAEAPRGVVAAAAAAAATEAAEATAETPTGDPDTSWSCLGGHLHPAHPTSSFLTSRGRVRLVLSEIPSAERTFNPCSIAMAARCASGTS